jgi:hypothetical protein
MVQLYVIYANCQRDDGPDSGEKSGGGVGGADAGYAEMSYSEFLEAISAVCMYKSCNPYQPFTQRLDIFLSQGVLPFVKGSQKPKINTAKQALLMTSSDLGSSKGRKARRRKSVSGGADQKGDDSGNEGGDEPSPSRCALYRPSANRPVRRQSDGGGPLCDMTGGFEIS